MTSKTYANRQVVDIIGITRRQILHWTEKDLVVPEKEATNPGERRGYSYVNLLEFGLCKALFEMGMGVYRVKQICFALRQSGSLHDWAIDFSGYLAKMVGDLGAWYDENAEMLRRYDQAGGIGDRMKKLVEFSKLSRDELLSKIPEHGEGVLVCTAKGKNPVRVIITSNIGTVLGDATIKRELMVGGNLIVLNLTVIKEIIDRKVNRLE